MRDAARGAVRSFRRWTRWSDGVYWQRRMWLRAGRPALRKWHAAGSETGAPLMRAVEDTVFQVFGGGGEDLLGDAVAFAVGVVAQAVETLFDAQTGGGTEVIDQFKEGVVFFKTAFGQHAVSARAGRADGEEFGADIDKAAKEDLFAFEFGTEFGHSMEKAARQFTAGFRGVAEGAPKHRRNGAIGS